MTGLPLQWIAAGLGFAYLLQSGTVSIKQVAIAGAAIVTGGLYLLYRFQENLLYQPRIFPQHLRPQDNPPGMRSPSEHGLPFEDVRVTAADGVKLHAWMLRPEDKQQRFDRPTIIFYHENAGNMGLRMEYIRMLYVALECNVVILSYRGYGESESVPTEEGLYLDGDAILRWLLTRDDIDRSRIVLFGRSLGGGVAIDVASKHEGDSGLPGKVAAVIVENTFSSISSMVDSVFPLLKHVKQVILRMKWDSVNKVPSITKPMLFISGTQDEIVPSVQMVALHAAALRASTKEWFEVPEGRHNDTWQRAGPEYIQRLRRFLEQHARHGAAAENLRMDAGVQRSAL